MRNLGRWLSQPFNAALVVALGLFLGCSSIPIDPSTPAWAAGDYTLGVSACEAAPGAGMDICRVTEGTKIDSDWVLVVPANFAHVVSGEVNVYYRDVQKSYAVTDKVVRIPWRDFFGSDTWHTEFDGEAMALLTLTYEDNNKIQKVQEFRGLAKIVVTKEGYARLPIDSGQAAWKVKCEIQYSTAGRSAIKCQ